MPRPNRARSLENEENLARRIAYERETREMTYEGLAQRMTDAGCATHASALYKIEKSTPPRKVTISELIVLAKIFETTTDDLLMPRELWGAQRAQELLDQLGDAASKVRSAVESLNRVQIELEGLTSDDLVIAELVARLIRVGEGGDPYLAVLESLGEAYQTVNSIHTPLDEEATRQRKTTKKDASK